MVSGDGVNFQGSQPTASLGDCFFKQGQGGAQGLAKSSRERLPKQPVQGYLKATLPELAALTEAGLLRHTRSSDEAAKRFLVRLYVCRLAPGRGGGWW